MKYIKTFESFSPINEEEIGFSDIKKGIEGALKGRYKIDLDGYKPSESAIDYEKKTGKTELYNKWITSMKKANPKSNIDLEKARLFNQALFDKTNKGISIEKYKSSDYMAPSLAGKDVTYDEKENSFSIQAGEGNWFALSPTGGKA